MPTFVHTVQQTSPGVFTNCCCDEPTVDLFVTKTYVGPTPLLVGQDGNFRVVVGNNGPATAVNAVVTDIVPFANASTVNDPVVITYADGATGPGSISWADLAAGLLVLPSVPVGGTATLNGSMNFYGPNEQGNNASVAADPSQTDTNPANNSADAFVSAVFPNAEVRVVKTISAPAFVVGDSGTITIVATNAGPQADPSVLVRDDTTTGLGPFLAFASPFNITYTDGATGPATVTQAAFSTFVGFIANMPVGSTVIVTMPFVAAADSSGAKPNTAQVITSLFDPDLANNTSTITATVSTTPVCCINIENIVVTPNPVPAGAVFSITADYRNCGTQALGAGFATISGFPTGVVAANGDTVTWSGIPTVGFTTLTLNNIQNNSAMAQTFTATISASSPCAIGSATDTDTTSITVQPPAPARTVDIFTVKTGSDPSTGTNQIFHNIYTNNGPDNANSLPVIDIPGTGYGSRWSLSTTAGVSLTYSGGAAGPATATVAQLLAGITIPTWPNGGQVDVAYSIHGDVAGTPNQNCANIVTTPGITISNPSGAEFCLPFLVTGVGNCSCASTYDVTPLNRVAGENFTAAYTLPSSGDLSCCNTVDFHTISYPTQQDAIDDTNGTDTVALATVTCASLGSSGSFPFVAGTTGWYRYYITVINNGSPQPQQCSISDSNQVFGNAPLQSKHIIAISGTWTYHTIT